MTIRERFDAATCFEEGQLPTMFESNVVTGSFQNRARRLPASNDDTVGGARYDALGADCRKSAPKLSAVHASRGPKYVHSEVDIS